METLAIIGIYVGIVIAALIYQVDKEIKYAKRRNWLYNIGLIETFNHIRRY